MASKVEIYTIFQLQQANAYTSQSEISRQVCSKIVSKDVYGFTCICAHMLAIAVNPALLFFSFWDVYLVDFMHTLLIKMGLANHVK